MNGQQIQIFERVDNGVKTTNRKAVYCCCCCTFMYFIFPCINVFMFKKNTIYMFIKRDIYNMSFIYVTFWDGRKLQVNSVCNFFFSLSQIVVNVLKNDKKKKNTTFHVHITYPLIFSFFLISFFSDTSAAGRHSNCK